MKSTICLEYIGASIDAEARLYQWIAGQVSAEAKRSFSDGKFSRKPWVAEVAGVCKKYGFKRNFIQPQTQYKRSSSTANRSVEMWFVVEVGRIYEIRHFTSWKGERRYFALIDDTGSTQEVSREWVKNQLG